jgi:hypothetical protein
MSALLSAPPQPAFGEHRHGPTLEDVVLGAWEGLVAGTPVACPVCASELLPRHSAGAGVVGGRCNGCGSSLG